MKTKTIKIFNLLVIMIISTFTILLSACTPKTPPNPPPPVIPTVPGSDKKIHELFSGYKVISRGDNIEIFDPVSNDTQTFNDMIKRQIDVLAQDILFRLVAVYGNPGTGAHTSTSYSNHSEHAYTLNDNIITQNNYEYNGMAFVSYHDIILKPSWYDSSEPVYLLHNEQTAKSQIDSSQYYVTDPATYAFLLYNASYSSNLFRNKFYLQDSIIGSYKISDSQSALDYDYNIAWNWDYSGTGIVEGENHESLYTKYMIAYFNKLKYAIASILAYGEDGILNGTNINYDVNEYNDMISEIDHIGYLQNDRENITTFVLEEVIGASVVNDDTNLYKPEGSYEILNPTNESTYPELYKKYKAYEVLVPNMLERAFLNSFGGLETVLNGLNEYDNFYEDDDYNDIYTLYPKASRAHSQELPIVVNENVDINNPPAIPMTEYLDIRSVILKPLDTAGVLELWLYLETLPQYKFDFMINVTYKGNGITYMNTLVSSSINKNPNKQIMSADGTDTWGYDLNIADYIIKSNPAYFNNYPTMSAYNGSNVTSFGAWNSPYGVVQQNGATGIQFNAGDNYRELSFLITNKYLVNGDILTPTNDTIPFKIGFSDPF